MSKKLLVDEITSTSPTMRTRADAEDSIDVVLGAIRRVVERGDKILLRGFGNFQMKDRKGRMGRNPSTGEPISIPAKRVLVFNDKR